MTPTPTDADLLARIAVGDRAAFEAFYRRHSVWLAMRLRYRCADASLVDDVVQETFLDLWRGGASRYREPGDVAGWLWRIGSRRLVDALRRQGAWDRLRHLLSWFRPSTESSAEDLVLRGVEHGDLGGALDRLSPELRAVVQATVLDGLSTGEAAVLLGIPPGTVKTRAMRARRQLRGELA
ncbi:RNA polymerase sigma factor [Virgisporangium ochraceum]|uniref:RNA polymerase sigma24 factor n=1 Tax=Virgisporangium ochraceum TaxID=65505 RepID=A0A8J3ZSD0_9ACTN|nr:RNA polymerase sigma factor [Virgisporangium ochraceum]GIJ67148.1 RNA polymerase sigma24 factor [Virgisporangium ochraceum]